MKTKFKSKLFLVLLVMLMLIGTISTIPILVFAASADDFTSTPSEGVQLLNDTCTHEYDNDCDTACNLCDATREVDGHQLNPYGYCKLCQVNILGASMTVGSDLSLNCYVRLADTYKNAVMYFEMESEKTDATVGKYDANSDCYIFTFNQLPPQTMGDTITATLMWSGEVLAEMKDYSIKDYAEALLKDNDSSDVLKQLVSDMLHYGAAAQNYTGYKTDALVTADVEGIKTASAVDLTNVTTDLTLSESTGTVKFTSAGVWFDYNNRLYVKVNSTENASVVVRANEQDVVTLQEDNTFLTDGISATDFDKIYTFDLYEGDTLVQTLTYSVKSYVLSMQNSQNESMKALANALYAYGKSAEAYKEELKTSNIGDTIQNDNGFSVDGGGFAAGSSLVSEVIQPGSSEEAEALEKIADQDYNKENDVHIFNIYVEKEEQKVQPDEKVTVSLPLPRVDFYDYLVFHIKDDGTVEQLVPTAADGKLTFEVDSFSRFIIIEDDPGRSCNHKLGALNEGKAATYFAEGLVSYYKCSSCGKLFNEDYERITSTIIPKLTPEFTIYLDDTKAGDLAVKSSGSSSITFTLESIAVTAGQTVSIRDKDGSEVYEYTVVGTDMDSAGTLWGNVDPTTQKIGTTSTSSFTVGLNKNEKMYLNADGFVHSGVVMEITSLDTGKKPVYFPMEKVDYLGDPTTQAYVFGLLGTDKYTSFRIIDLDNDKIYDYDDVSESMSWDTWSYSRGKNDSIQFASTLTDWWIAFDIGGDGKITLRRFNFSTYYTPTLVFKSGEAPTFEKVTLEEGTEEYARYTFALNSEIFDRTDFWLNRLPEDIDVYRATVTVDTSVSFYVNLQGLTKKLSKDYLSEVALKSGSLTVSGNYILLNEPGEYIIEYLPFCNVINVIDPRYVDGDPAPHEHNFVDGKCECGDEDPDYEPPHEHSYTEVVTAPTCTEDGYTTYTCGGCGDTYVDNVVTAPGHSYSEVVTPPTCTEDGYTTHTCGGCGDSYVDTRVAATGHNYVNGKCECGEEDPDYVPDSDSKIIDRIDVLGVTMPYTGESPVIGNPYVLQAGLKVLSVQYGELDYDDNFTPYTSGYRFEYENSRYTIRVRLELQDGYQLYYNSEYDYYDVYATVNYVLAWRRIEPQGNVVEYYVDLGCNDKTIYYAGIVSTSGAVFKTIAIPGAHPDFNFITVYEGFHISEIRWYDESESDGTPGGGRLMTEDEVFVEGVDYYLEVDIEVDEGYSFFADVYGVWVSVFIDDLETGAGYDDIEEANYKLTLSTGYYCMYP